VSIALGANGGHAADPYQRDLVRTFFRVIGELMITLGIIVFLFIGYELWFTGLYTERQQHNITSQLEKSWAAPPTAAPVASGSGSTPPTPSTSGSALSTAPSGSAAPPSSVPADLDRVVPGDAIGIIRIPRLGASYSYAIIQGTSTADLKKGPGHYLGTALPGQIGNLVISGHRTTYLAPFNGLGDLAPGDAIVVETRDTWYTYRVTGSRTVLPTEVGVLLPVPDKPGVKPTQALITLTTCTPKYSASHRLVIDGQLESATPKSAGPPAALAGG
jgi:sortase A